MRFTQDSYPPLPALLPLFLTPLEPPSPGTLTLAPKPPPMYPDDPFLVSYIAYHHYRSLGWVVKPGIKFCCDWLLYRRGPAFSHSA
jgi:tRNA-splicing endonuclease subunit Sen2